MRGVANEQDIVVSIVGGSCEMNRAIRMQERRASFLNKSTSRIGQLGSPFSIAIEQLESVLFLKLRDLPAEGRLGYAQAMGGPREI
jgi:hypothetical protein